MISVRTAGWSAPFRTAPPGRLERVVNQDRTLVLLIADPVKQKVHDTQSRGVVNNLPTLQRPIAKFPFFVRIKEMVLRNPLVRREQKPARTARRVGDPTARFGSHNLDDRSD